jgi:hypothetical protein
MKTLKFLSLTLVTLFLVNCSYEEKTIDKVFENTTNGIALRTRQVISNEFNIDNASTTNFNINIEIQSQSSGTLCSSIKVLASYQDKNGTGNNRAETLVKTIPSSSFSAGDRGLQVVNIKVLLSEVKTILNLTNAQVKTCDATIFRLIAVDNNGKEYTVPASGTVTGGSYFSSPYLYNVNVKGGPFPDNLAGTHTFVTSNMYIPGTATCGGSVTGNLVLGATSVDGVYTINDLSFGLFESSCWFDTPAVSATSRLKWFCKEITSTGTDQYGSTWDYKVKSCVGNKLTLEFKSSYGTGEGGKVVITRQGNLNWPTILQQ